MFKWLKKLHNDNRGFAKVDGPLFSLEARGKIAEAIVFFPWKGRHVVRQWLKPTNPKSIDQGYLRAALKAIGRWIKIIQCGQVAGEVESLLYSGATDNVSAGTNWNAWLGEGFLNLIQLAHTLVKTSFDNLVSEFNTDISTDVRTEFEDQAASLALSTFAFGYGYTEDITPGLQLYFGAKACYMQSIIATSPWNADPTTWDTSDVSQFGSYHTTDA